PAMPTMPKQIAANHPTKKTHVPGRPASTKRTRPTMERERWYGNSVSRLRMATPRSNSVIESRCHNECTCSAQNRSTVRLATAIATAGAKPSEKEGEASPANRPRGIPPTEQGIGNERQPEEDRRELRDCGKSGRRPTEKSPGRAGPESGRDDQG